MGKYSEAFIAFDTAKLKHAVAIAEGSREGEVRYLGEVENQPGPIGKLIKKLAARYGKLHVCFEAGPTGYRFYRQIQGMGHDCLVVAPALIPKRSGERVKTNLVTRSPWLGCFVPANSPRFGCLTMCTRPFAIWFADA